MTIPFWLKEPTILLNQKYIKEVWCDSSMTSGENSGLAYLGPPGDHLGSCLVPAWGGTPPP